MNKKSKKGMFKEYCKEMRKLISPCMLIGTLYGAPLGVLVGFLFLEGEYGVMAPIVGATTVAIMGAYLGIIVASFCAGFRAGELF